MLTQLNRFSMASQISAQFYFINDYCPISHGKVIYKAFVQYPYTIPLEPPGSTGAVLYRSSDECARQTIALHFSYTWSPVTAWTSLTLQSPRRRNWRWMFRSFFILSVREVGTIMAMVLTKFQRPVQSSIPYIVFTLKSATFSAVHIMLPRHAPPLLSRSILQQIILFVYYRSCMETIPVPARLSSFTVAMLVIVVTIILSWSRHHDLSKLQR